MKIEVDGTAKEIADLVVNIQNRQSGKENIGFKPVISLVTPTTDDMFVKELKKYLGLHLQ